MQTLSLCIYVARPTVKVPVVKNFYAAMHVIRKKRCYTSILTDDDTQVNSTLVVNKNTYENTFYDSCRTCQWHSLLGRGAMIFWLNCVAGVISTQFIFLMYLKTLSPWKYINTLYVYGS